MECSEQYGMPTDPEETAGCRLLQKDLQENQATKSWLLEL